MRKKLKLNVDSLRVDGFETQAVEGKRGTVRGHVTDETYDCGESRERTVCDYSCAWTCAPGDWSCYNGCTWVACGGA